jgi:hypothetical protein
MELRGHSIVSQHFMEPECSIPNSHSFHLFLSLARPIQSTSPHPTSPRSILILFTHLRLCLPSGLFPSGFPANIVGVCILLRVLSNHKIKPSFTTTSKMCFISCSLWSLHVSAFTRGHLQVIICKHKKKSRSLFVATDPLSRIVR